MPSIVMKKHAIGGQSVIAAADVSFLGKKYSDGRRVLDLQAYRSFYEGEHTDAFALKTALKNCDSANLVGDAAVMAAIEAGFAKKSDVGRIGTLPHLQLYNVPKE